MFEKILKIIKSIESSKTEEQFEACRKMIDGFELNNDVDYWVIYGLKKLLKDKENGESENKA